MCGIAGIHRALPGPDDRPVVRRMLDAMGARGPDGEGLVQDGPLTLGHRRLAILDLSSAAAQPMATPDGRYLISFNGEIYNFRELAAEMALAPGRLRTTSDTEVLLAAWERWGPACLDRLVGQWAFAVHDRRDQRLWLARDRFGEKPLYYHEESGTLAFASSIPALLRAPWVSRETSPEALEEYLTLRYVVSPRTVLREVRKVPPGHLLERSRGATGVRGWWSPKFRRPAFPDSARGRRQATEEFGRRLAQAARRCLVSDVPVGLLLSDGIDSNSIHAALREAGAPVATYTWRATSRGSSRSTAAPAGGPAGDASVRFDMNYDETAAHAQTAFAAMTEPVGDGAALATYVLIRQAREQATVFLCGHGGDELLGGYRLSQERFRIAAMHHLCRLPLRALDRMTASYTNGPEAVRDRRRAITLGRAREVPAAARYLVQKPLPFDDLRSLFAPHPLREAYLGAVDRLYADCDDRAADLDRIQEVMLRTFLSENLLSLADSMAMASSAELRLPYLDRDLADLTFHLPPAMRSSRWPGLANTKQILRWWARDRVPDEVLARRKRGFRFGTIRNLLASPRARIRERVMASGPLRQHLPGLEAWSGQAPEVYRRGRETTYWSLLTFAVWGEAAGVI